jgi:hypothetical protein
MISTAIALSTFNLLVLTATSAVANPTAMGTINSTGDSCLNNPYSLPRGVIILDTRNAYDPLNITRPVVAGSEYHYINSCVNANIRRKPGSWSRVRRNNSRKRGCAIGNYENTRMCDYNDERIPAEIDMVDCGQCDTDVGKSMTEASCRLNGEPGVWRPETVDILLPFRTATGTYELKKQGIAIGCRCTL